MLSNYPMIMTHAVTIIDTETGQERNVFLTYYTLDIIRNETPSSFSKDRTNDTFTCNNVRTEV